ncbi:hypothetical protein [Streptomyces sp. NPDC002785]|uniref:hypothetical protein n=1 Tax=Streptomyces sp. NPDC002785 TaxID=3154543 RepID=UPI003329AC8C
MPAVNYFTETGWMAFFSGTDTEIGRQRGVEAWHPTTGQALVVDPQRGKLRPVTDFEDFSHLERVHRIVEVMPGGGWRAHWDDEGGAPLTQPVLAWLISSEGSATPVTVEPNGDIDSSGTADRILAPGQELRDG